MSPPFAARIHVHISVVLTWQFVESCCNLPYTSRALYFALVIIVGSVVLFPLYLFLNRLRE
jgi:hypothetical protein